MEEEEYLDINKYIYELHSKKNNQFNQYNNSINNYNNNIKRNKSNNVFKNKRQNINKYTINKEPDINSLNIDFEENNLNINNNPINLRYSQDINQNYNFFAPNIYNKNMINNISSNRFGHDYKFKKGKRKKKI